ncbi:sugar phosphate isomerase/epimerase family protein [Parapedobacter koreensis]|uniref:Sugar phosphate isomerase/epimerase n=1 Tax=Parapedobacter koreensis TaxID=332977 RepID=A0A1H7PCH0_9SPHI|nr:TIM barrel protein [Parapedobacter koreensis]SEL33349.1 Sugar phosphate isomerase/epimerase [Parapedobacter koreensis]
MSSAFDQLTLRELISTAQYVGVQGIDLCVFRLDGTRQDHTATHLDYDHFTLDTAKQLIEDFNAASLGLSLGAFENMIGGDPAERIKNQNHLLKLIRIAYLLGGDANDVKVGTFVGYNHELGAEEGGFQKNLDEYKRVFGPIIKYAEDMGVTILYENCPMEGWRSASFTTTFNNLAGVLAARKLMYALIPSRAHGEIYDPSHDIWQHTDPVDVIAQSDISRIQRIHVKTTRNLKTKARVDWGGMYPMQTVDKDLAAEAGVAIPAHDWDRHHYEAMLPGFGGSDSMDWRAFADLLTAKGFDGPYEIENEAKNSKDTGNISAIVQGYQATVGFLSPMLWNLDESAGYKYRNSQSFMYSEMHDVPVRTIDQL